MEIYATASELVDAMDAVMEVLDDLSPTVGTSSGGAS